MKRFLILKRPALDEQYDRNVFKQFCEFLFRLFPQGPRELIIRFYRSDGSQFSSNITRILTQLIRQHWPSQLVTLSILINDKRKPYLSALATFLKSCTALKRLDLILERCKAVLGGYSTSEPTSAGAFLTQI